MENHPHKGPTAETQAVFAEVNLEEGGKYLPPDPWGSATEYLNKSISLATFIFSYKKYASKYFLQAFFLFSPLFLGSFFLPKPTVHHSQRLK